MIFVMGLGGAGGNVADKASEKGFMTGAINFSKQDLDSLDNVKAKFRLQGSDGAGKNREEAKRLLNDQLESVVGFIQEHCDHPTVDVVAFAFSTGGGTGSGIAPTIIELATVLLPEKVVIAIPLLPDYSEVDIPQMNTAQLFEEISKLDIAIFPADNQKVKERNENFGKGKLFENVNEHVVDLLSKMVEYTGKYSKDGNFDRKDLLTVLNTKGIGLIAEVEFDRMVEGKVNVTKDGVAESVQRSWCESVFTTIELSHVMRAAVILDADEEWMGLIDHDLIFNCFTAGKPIDLFEGNYHDNSAKILTILTGMAWCNGRLQEIENKVKENEQKIDTMLSESENQSYVSSTSSISSKIRKQTPKKENVTDLLAKFRQR